MQQTDRSAAMQTADEVVSALNRQTANAWTLYHNLKKHHWQVYGPEFRSLHKLFEDQAEELLESLDDMAERIRAFQKNPVFALEAIPQTASVPCSTPGFQTTREMVQEALDAHAQIIVEMKQDIRIAEDHDDPGTADLLSGIIQVHEKQAWMLREYLHPSGLETDMSGGDLHSARAGVPADMSAARTSGA